MKVTDGGSILLPSVILTLHHQRQPDSDRYGRKRNLHLCLRCKISPPSPFCVFVAEMNPLRYRGYYYDTETGFYYLQSRYYDPNLGRFINADAYSSTGQGILGNNMYAYCNNNPVILSDPQGYAAGWTNTVAICDGGSSRFIYNQNHETYERMFLGLASVAHGGCGPIGVNNALQLLGNNSASLQEIIDFYKNAGGIRLGGLLGTSFEATAGYFDQHGYDTVTLSTDEIYKYSGIEKSFDAGIILFGIKDPNSSRVGLHFVAFRQYDDVGYYYNVYSNSTGVNKYSGSLVDFLTLNNFFPLALLLISGGN